jgi:hypothetical protein
MTTGVEVVPVAARVTIAEYFPQTNFRVADLDPEESGFATTLRPEQVP